MLEIINFVFPLSAFVVSSSRWGSDSASGDDGCLGKVIDSLMKTSSLRRGHEGGPYVLWCNSGCRGSWILI